MSLGSILKSARKSARLTLREIEDCAGISNAYLSQLENDKIKNPSAITLYRLSNLLKIDFDELMVTAGFVDPKEGEDYRPSRLISMRVTSEEEAQLIRFLAYVRKY